jgi:hypothetical protein
MLATRCLTSILVLVLSLALACSDDSTTVETKSGENLPEWVAELIQRLESEPVANPPLFIARYAYKDEVVYYLPPRCCDTASFLYRADGALICRPDGGFSGSGDGRCHDFFLERTNEEIIWRDQRSAG